MSYFIAGLGSMGKRRVRGLLSNNVEPDSIIGYGHRERTIVTDPPLSASHNTNPKAMLALRIVTDPPLSASHNGLDILFTIPSSLKNTLDAV